MRYKRKALLLAQCLMAMFVVLGAVQMASANAATCSAEVWVDRDTGAEYLMSGCNGTCQGSTPPCRMVVQPVHGGSTIYWCRCGPGTVPDDECELRWTGGVILYGEIDAVCYDHSCDGTCPEADGGSPNGDPDVGTRICPCQ